MLAFKIMDDPFVGTITFCRIYSGKLNTGDGLVNSTRDRKERVGRMLLMHANNREDIKEAFAGDIVALAGLKETRTGDTLCDPNKPVILEKMDFPEPVIEMAVEPKSKADQKSWRRAGEAARGRSVFPRQHRSGNRSDDHQGDGRASPRHQDRHSAPHLQSRSQRRRAASGVSRKARRAVQIDYTHKKQTGGSGQFARVIIDFAPGEPGSGFVFENKVVGGSVPKEFVPGVEKGLEQSKENGLLAGFPMIDFSATLVEGDYHDVDSSVLAFQIAAQAAFRELKDKGSIRLLEPIMKVEVVTPDEYTGSVIGDLNSRRGMIQGQDMRGNAVVVNAMVPLANMFGYVSQLRSFSQGRANYTMLFDHYEEVPQAVAKEVVAKLRASRAIGRKLKPVAATRRAFFVLKAGLLQLLVIATRALARTANDAFPLLIIQLTFRGR